MKQYKDYMDAVEVSDSLHQKLTELETPQKRPASWKKYGAAAAALVLVAGVGAWGLSRSEGDWNALMENFKPAAEAAPEIADVPVPDIAIEDPDGNFTAQPSGGGYEVVEGGLAYYYVLPYLNWVDASAQPQTAADYALAPPGAISRDASLEDALILTGDIDGFEPGHNWANHLQWHYMDWGGKLWFLEDGTPQAAALYADESGLHLSLEVMKGGEVPSCIVLPEDSYERSTWGGVEITALKGGGYAVIDGVELWEKREVNFFCDGVGYKLTLYADDAVRANEMCAWFVRYAVDGGFHLYALSYEPAYDEDMPSENRESFSCPYCADGTVHTHPYDPNAAAEAKAPTPPN